MSARHLIALCVLLLAVPMTAAAQSNPHQPQAAAEHQHAPAPVKNYLSEASREALMSLMVQDYQGRMKPLDTLSRESMRKIAKRTRFEGWEPMDIYMSFTVHGSYWFGQPVIAVRNQGVKDLLGLPAETRHVSLAELVDDRGQFRYRDDVEVAFRTADRERSKVQRKLLDFYDRMNVLLMAFNQTTLRLYPLPHDENHTWLGIQDLLPQVPAEHQGEFLAANSRLIDGLAANNEAEILAAVRDHEVLQARYGAEVLMSDAALKSELFLNGFDPFRQVMTPFLLAFLLLLAAYIWCLARRDGQGFSLRQPLYLVGNLVYWLSVIVFAAAFVMRWIASGRAPLSNGYESLIWIGLIVAVGGIIFERLYPKGLVAAQASLLTMVILGVALLSAFNPAIGPLVPVLASYWLNIHVTIITASYAFLGLAALMAMTLLILHLFKGPGRDTIHQAVKELHQVHWWELVTGLGLLSIGTLLGGVWANESWGRYWGWDSKETWSLVTILVYAVVTHFRYIPGLNRPWATAAASFLALASVIMTYFGVNYFLSGLHSYAAGEAAKFPNWAWIAIAIAIVLLAFSWWRDRSQSWQTGSRA